MLRSCTWRNIIVCCISAQLMRFQYCHKLIDKIKIHRAVHVPLCLTVTADSIDGSPAMSVAYELVSVVYHTGARAHSGHYTADCWDDARQKWWYFDDDCVTEKQKQAVVDVTEAPKKGKARKGPASKKPRVVSKAAPEDSMVLISDDSESSVAEIVSSDDVMAAARAAAAEDVIEVGDDDTTEEDVVAHDHVTAMQQSPAVIMVIEPDGSIPKVYRGAQPEFFESPPSLDAPLHVPLDMPPPPMSSVAPHPVLSEPNHGSKLAYLLMYRRIGSTSEPTFQTTLSPPADVLSPELQLAVQVANDKFDAEKTERTLDINQRLELIAQRKSLYQKAFGVGDSNSGLRPWAQAGEPCVWVPVHWLKQWIAGEREPESVFIPEDIDMPPDAKPALPVNRSNSEFVVVESSDDESGGVVVIEKPIDVTESKPPSVEAPVSSDVAAGGGNSVDLTGEESTSPAATFQSTAPELFTEPFRYTADFWCKHSPPGVDPAKVKHLKRLNLNSYLCVQRLTC
jgi:hypothetical protein